MHVGETKEIGNWRFHRYAHSFQALDIEHIGKRGKKCVEISVDLDSTDHTPSSLILDLAPSLGVEAMKALFETVYMDETIHTYEVRGVDVPLTPINLHGSNWTLSSDGQMASVQESEVNEYTLLMTKSSAKKFYNWVVANQDKISEMKFRDWSDLIDTLGLKVHAYCALD